jgi:hypothetical protein
MSDRKNFDCPNDSFSHKKIVAFTEEFHDRIDIQDDKAFYWLE